MKKTGLYTKVSINYWKNHINKMSIIHGSKKETILEEELRLLGDYDLILYNLDVNDSNTIEELPQITKHGSYIELGYAEGNEGTCRTKIACFEDEESEKLYHMTCTEGTYPQSENEVVIDANIAKLCGVRPEVGNTIELQLYNLENDKIESKIFTIAGIFKASDRGVYGGWERYPTGKEIGTYDMPGIFLSTEMNTLFESTKVCTLLQTEEQDKENLADVIFELLQEHISYDDIDIVNGRTYAYSYVLGIATLIYEEYGDMSLENIVSAMQDGNVIKDFYSGVLIPIFGFLIFMIAFISMFEIVRNIINDKKEQFAIFRCVGITRTKLGIYFFVDFLIVTMIAIVMGLVLGVVIHLGMIRFMNLVLGMRIGNAFAVSTYVKSVTANPLWYATGISLVCFFIASIVPIIRFMKHTPAALLQNLDVKRITKRTKSKGKMKSWRAVLKNRMELFDMSILIITIINMSVIVFGYVYFSALSDSESTALAWEKEENGLSAYDYVVKKSDDMQMYNFNIENRHNCGVTMETYQKIASHDYVERMYACILNKSTRLAYADGEISDEMKEYLSKYSLRSYEEVETEFEQHLMDADNAMISAIGYGDNEYIYSLPTIGMTENNLVSLENNVIAGEVDLEAVASGKEVILAVSENDCEEVTKYFHVGDVLPLSDIVLSKEEDNYDFSQLLPMEVAKPIYEEDVVTDEGEEVTLTSYAFGKRKNIQVKIGAIVSFDETVNDSLPLLCDYLQEYEEEAGYGIYALCGTDAFDIWGLPDQLFTSVEVKLKEDADMDVVDADWYSALAGSKGVSIHTIKEITDNQKEIKIKNMSVYYMMATLLLLLGTIASMIAMYGRMRFNGQEFAYLRAVGMNNSQIYRVLLEESFVYPIAGIMFSTAPVWACQLLFMYIRKMIDSGKWESYAIDTLPWYAELPFQFNLYEYHMMAVLIVVFVMYMLINIVIIIPGFVYIKKQNVVNELEMNTF